MIEKNSLPRVARCRARSFCVFQFGNLTDHDQPQSDVAGSGVSGSSGQRLEAASLGNFPKTEDKKFFKSTLVRGSDLETKSFGAKFLRPYTSLRTSDFSVGHINLDPFVSTEELP